VLRLNPRDAGGYDGLARIWRDWGFPHLGLGDAYRAVYYAPHSAAPFNTLGTILQAMGRGLPARGAYERALRLDSEASYALYNLCRLPVSAEQRDAAASACQLALRLSPRLENRSGSVTGESDPSTRFRSPAERELFNALYDLGILYLRQHRFSEATSTFQRASVPRVALPDAVVHRTNTTAVEGIR
jgi:tetratricopeptide (TPR) repeat protein